MVSFSTDGWVIKETGDLERIWINKSRDVLALRFFQDATPADPRLSRIDKVRDQFRVLAASGGGALIQADPLVVDRVRILRTIMKFPQQPHGMGYGGLLTIPLMRGCFGINVRCPELGVTGVRDATVWQQFRPPRESDADDPFAGWCEDPYDPSYRGTLLRNRADDEKWDSIFPDHPLSRVRLHLGQIETTMEFHPEVKALRDDR